MSKLQWSKSLSLAPASVQPDLCATPLSSNALVPMVDPGMTLDAVATPSPDAPELSKSDKAHFTKMRKVVEFKEMDMAALCSHSGIGACLKTMADDECNPTLLDGEHMVSTAGGTTAELVPRCTGTQVGAAQV